MDSYTCFVCETPFERYASQVRNPAETCCSVECRGVKHRTSLRGEANPNYRHGKHVGPSLCVCGRAKDYRAEACALCSKRGPSKSGESLYDEDVLREAVLTSTSLSAAAMLVGCSRHTVTSFAKKNDLNLSHMRGGRGRPRSYESVFATRRRGTQQRGDICEGLTQSGTSALNVDSFPGGAEKNSRCRWTISTGIAAMTAETTYGGCAPTVTLRPKHSLAGMPLIERNTTFGSVMPMSARRFFTSDLKST